jgi:hypothetical protein
MQVALMGPRVRRHEMQVVRMLMNRRVMHMLMLMLMLMLVRVRVRMIVRMRMLYLSVPVHMLVSVHVIVRMLMGVHVVMLPGIVMLVRHCRASARCVNPNRGRATASR